MHKHTKTPSYAKHVTKISLDKLFSVEELIYALLVMAPALKTNQTGDKRKVLKNKQVDAVLLLPAH